MKNVRPYTDVPFRTEFITPFVSRLLKKNALASLSPSQLTRVASISGWLYKILRTSSNGILLERQLHGPFQIEAREPNWIPYKLGSHVCPALYWGKESGSFLSCVLKAPEVCIRLTSSSSFCIAWHYRSPRGPQKGRGSSVRCPALVLTWLPVFLPCCLPL